MNNQLAITEIEVLLKRVALIAVIVMVALLIWIFGIPAMQSSDPYVESVLSRQGNVQRGAEIFQMNCAGCHAWQAESQVGPSLRDVSQRKSEVGIIKQVISGQTPPMPQFQPSVQEMADLLSYLEQL